MNKVNKCRMCGSALSITPQLMREGPSRQIFGSGLFSENTRMCGPIFKLVFMNHTPDFSVQKMCSASASKPWFVVCSPHVCRKLVYYVPRMRHVRTAQCKHRVLMCTGLGRVFHNKIQRKDDCAAIQIGERHFQQWLPLKNFNFED